MSEATFPWRTLLLASVAINLLVAGALVGAYASGVRLERAAASGQLPGPRVMMAALPQTARAKVRDQLARTWVETRALRQQAAQARRDAFDTAAAEPFDAVRVRAAFAHVREADAASLAAFHNNMIDAFAAMTPAERQRAIAALRNAGPGRRAAQRQSEIQPAGDPGQGENLTPRQRLREAVRERMRERRQQRQGIAP